VAAAGCTQDAMNKELWGVQHLPPEILVNNMAAAATIIVLGSAGLPAFRGMEKGRSTFMFPIDANAVLQSLVGAEALATAPPERKHLTDNGSCQPVITLLIRATAGSGAGADTVIKVPHDKHWYHHHLVIAMFDKTNMKRRPDLFCVPYHMVRAGFSSCCRSSFLNLAFLTFSNQG
jgi:hypothetical protein